ncbi:MAG: hypothetical protein HN976_40855 [Lentisphaerae bacterium]|nr:hypothetical protein [Lentisphaerota bacterium]MBT7061508.1 hypothetical protein [Lentisphaerota bacterium]
MAPVFGGLRRGTPPHGEVTCSQRGGGALLKAAEPARRVATPRLLLVCLVRACLGAGPSDLGQGRSTTNAPEEAGENEASRPEDIRFTTQGRALYATALGWPEDGIFTVTSLALCNPHDARPIQSVQFTSGGGAIDWEQTNDGLIFRILFEEVGTGPLSSAQ